ncbi:MAG: pyridoxal phosphate-dependent aminotransferase [Pseudopedobacter saltans]|uniref:Pyridoxal phosphate-dependent aminotransferase n=1 Tax=Pseudopedobacter saltans TaxID=151895 RepID=A0A2W5EYP7_9SPHI|nr:MAG: pyridoxal phosphate-dependent aminotransferase [Pseudopedobacter saltans]
MSTIRLSERAMEMPASPIRKLVPFADAAKKKGIKVYHLNIGQPDIETPKVAMDAVRNVDMKVLEYGHSAGIESYRKKLAEYYNRVGIDVSYEDILITTGGSEALLFGFLACMNPGDEVVIPEPFYANYNGFAIEAGVKIVTIPSYIDNGFALPPIESFEKAITNKTKAIVLCNPNNPTGYLYSKEEIETLRDIAVKHNLFLFSDEAYREFCYEGAHFSALQLEGADDNVVLMDTISKRYSACGARIGAFVSKNKELIQQVLKFGQARLCPPTLEQVLAEAAVDLPSNYFEETKAEYLRRRDVLVKGLNAIPGVKCPNPGGAFYVMAELPIDDCDKFCQWILENFEYNGQTVMMAPGSGFYATPGLGKKEVRLAYVLNVSDIENSVICLSKALEQYNR